MKKHSDFIIRPYTHKELAYRYQISRKTLLKWLRPFQKEIGPRVGHFYTTLQVEIILEKLGLPYMDVN